jgi:large-conductance mechanosensitive channel
VTNLIVARIALRLKWSIMVRESLLIVSVFPDVFISFLIFLIVSQNIKARAKLEKEEEDAEAALKLTIAHLTRVRKQKRALKKKGDDLFARGMQS